MGQEKINVQQQIKTIFVKDVENLSAKGNVRAATVAPITLSGTQTIDNIALVADDRCLVKNQADAATNGIYDVKAGAWVRSADSNSSEAMSSGTQTYVQDGLINGGQIWLMETLDPITLGVTGLVWKRIANAVDVGSPIGLTDAPSDGVTYGRRNADWVEVIDTLGDQTIANNLMIAGSSATLELSDSDGSVDNKEWHIISDSEELRIRPVDDSGIGGSPIGVGDAIVIQRTGVIADVVNLTGTINQSNGNEIISTVGGQTIDGDLTLHRAGVLTNLTLDSDDGFDTYLTFAENSTRRGLLAYNEASDIMVLQKYDTNGTTLKTNLVLTNTGEVNVTVGTLQQGGFDVVTNVGGSPITNGYVLTWNASNQRYEPAVSQGEGGGSPVANVFKVGTPADNQVGVWTGDGTIEGDANFTWSSGVLEISSTFTELRLTETGVSNGDSRLLANGDDLTIQTPTSGNLNIQTRAGAATNVLLTGTLDVSSTVTIGSSNIVLDAVTSNTLEVASQSASEINLELQTSDLVPRATFSATNANDLTITADPVLLTGDLYISGNITGAGSPVANGDVLTWVAANSQFEPQAPAGGGNVSNTGTPVNNQLAIWTDATTVEGDANLTWSGSILLVTGELDVRNAFGAMYLYDNNSTGTAAGNRILMRDQTSANIGNIGFIDGDGSLQVNNEIGDVKIKSQTGQVLLQQTDTDVARTIIETSGGFEVNNTLTGAGWERVLTTSDLGGGGSPVANVFKVGTPADNQVGVWTGDGTLEGDSNITWDGSTLDVGGDLIISGNITGVGSPATDVTINSDLVVTGDIKIPSVAKMFFDGGSNDYISHIGSALVFVVGGGQILNIDGQGLDMFGKVNTAAGIAGRAGLNIKTGVAPTSPIDGDTWTTAAGEFFVRLNGASVDLAAGGTVSAYGSPVPLNNEVAIWTDGTTIQGDSNFTWDGSTLSLTGQTNLGGNVTIGDGGGTLQTNVVNSHDTGLMVISGGSTDQLGANILLYGATLTTGDMLFRNDGNTWMRWDETAGDLEISTGIGVKTTAMTLDDVNGTTHAQKVTFLASATGDPSFNIPEGVAPSAPVDGDVWVTAAGEFFVRLNGVSTDLATSGGGAGSPVANVFKVGTPVDNQVGVWTGDGTIEGSANLTWNDTTLHVAGAANFDTSVTINGASPTTLNIVATAGNARLNLDAPNPQLRFDESDAGLDQKIWEIDVIGETLNHLISRDNFGTNYNYMIIERSGTDVNVQVDSIEFRAENSITLTTALTTLSGDVTIEGYISANGGSPIADGDVLTWVAANNQYEPQAAGGGGLFTEDGDSNIIGGTGAGANLTAASGLSNFFAGINAGGATTTGDDNVAIGSNALYDASAAGTGRENVAIGKGAMESSVLTSAFLNIAISTDTLTALTTGAYNIALGANAFNRLTAANNVVGLGQSAGIMMISGERNIAIGTEALGITAGGGSGTGSYNIAIGSRAISGTNLTTSANNIGIGRGTLPLVSSADSNVAVGYQAGAKITTGDNNVMIGTDAGPTANQSNRLYLHNAESNTPLIGGDFSTGEVQLSGTMRFTERANHIGTFPAATFGELWVRTATPNELVFTDDAGTDWLLNQSSGGTIGGSIADNQVAIGNGSDAIDGSAALTFDGSTLSLTGAATISNGLDVTSGNVNMNGQVLSLGSTAPHLTHLSTLDVIEHGAQTFFLSATNDGGSHYIRGGYHNGSNWVRSGIEEVSALSFLGTGNTKLRSAIAGSPGDVISWIDAIEITNGTGNVLISGDLEVAGSISGPADPITTSFLFMGG